MLIVLTTWIAFYAINEIFPFGPQYFMTSDGHHQYIPFLYNLKRVFEGEKDFFFTWNLGAGTDFYTIFCYYLTSPFNLLLFLIPENYIEFFYMFLLIAKTMLMALTMGLFVKNHLHINNAYTTIAGCIWSLNGFIIANVWNIMWLDVLIIYPLLIEAFFNLINKKEYKSYIFWLALSIWCCFYLSVIVCLSLVILFFLFNDWKNSSLKEFTIASLLSGGINAIILIPSAIVLFNKHSSEPVKLEFFTNFFKSISPFFIGADQQVITMDFAYAASYISVAFLTLLMMAFVISKNKKFKVCFGTLLLTYLLSINFWPLNFLMHGFHMPVGIPNRFIFCFIFFFIAIGVSVINSYEPNETTFKEGFKLIGIMCLVILFIDVPIYCKIINMIVVVLTWIFINKDKNLFILLLIAELMINALVVLPDEIEVDPDIWDYNKLLVQSAEQKDYELFSGTTDTSVDAGMLSDVPSRAGFSSMFSDKIDAFTNLGMPYNFNATYDRDINELITSLFGVKYYTAEYYLPMNSYYKNYKKYSLSEEKTRYLLRNEKDVSFIHVFDDDIELNNDPIANINAIGEHFNEGPIYEPIDIDLKYLRSIEAESWKEIRSATDDVFELHMPKGEYVFLSNVNAVGVYFYIYKDDEIIRERYIYIANNGIFEISVPENDKIEMYVTYSDEKARINNNSFKQKANPLVFYKYNRESLLALADKVNETAQYNVHLNKDSLDVVPSEDGLLIIGSLYSPGWKAYKNGEKVNIEEVLGGFLGIEANADDNICLKYRTPGIIPGCTISLICLALAYTFVKKKIDVSQN